VTNRKVLKKERKKKERKKKIGRMRNNSRCLTAVRAIGASIQKKGISFYTYPYFFYIYMAANKRRKREIREKINAGK
jgi:hypothetical protein